MVPLNEGNPSEYDSLAAEFQRGFDDTGKLPDRLIRYAFARDRALINLTQIEKREKSLSFSPLLTNYQKIRPRIAQCGDYLVFKHYYTAGKIRLTAANFCMVSLLCPLCAIRRGTKSLDAYMKRLAVIRIEHPVIKMSMLTLTIKNGDDLKERFKHLKKSISVMLERRRKALAGARGWNSEFAKILGLVGSIETTKDNGFGEVKETGWHVHAHIMILHYERFEYSKLIAEWEKITGDSKVLHVDFAKHPDDPAQDFLEVFKYALKFLDLTPEENIHAYEVMRGKRLLFSAGLFWGVEIPESMFDEELDELPYIELFYKYLKGSGYNLVKTFDSENLEPGQKREKAEKVKISPEPKMSDYSPYDHLPIPEDIIKSLRDGLIAISKETDIIAKQ